MPDQHRQLRIDAVLSALFGHPLAEPVERSAGRQLVGVAEAAGQPLEAEVVPMPFTPSVNANRRDAL